MMGTKGLTMRLATAQQMRDLDAVAINNFGIPGIVLMENAGLATVVAIVRRWGDPADRQFGILVGPGNNGGDGLVIARHLHELGGRPTIYLLVELDKVKGDAAINLALVRQLSIPVIQVLDEEAMATAAAGFVEHFLLVDALFGTGLQRPVAGLFQAIIQAVNRSSLPVVAVDVPSGLNSDTGMVLGECVRADLTVTLGLAKPGLFLYPGRELAGLLEIVDIGIPPEAQHQLVPHLEVLEAGVMGRLLPNRPPAAHKGSFGHLLVVAGSTGKTGAALLAARAGLRAGSGLVTMVVPTDLNLVFESALAEAMTLPMPGSDAGYLSAVSLSTIREALVGKQAVALGPGLGIAKETVDLVAALYREIELPMVVDADGLNSLVGRDDLLRQAPGPRVLTPHPGEMARLLGVNVKEVQADRLTIACDFAREHDVILVLKGAATVIAAPNGRVAINPSGNAGMAAGGMGDVLTGLIGGLLAQGCTPWEAACLGVFAHGLAADRLALAMRCGYLASEVANELPKVLTELADCRPLDVNLL